MPALYVVKGPGKGSVFRAGDEPFVMGRTSGQFQLADSGTSRRHAEIRPVNGAWILQDLNSANGTYLNGERVITPRSLHNGDQIKIGRTILVFSGGDDGSGVEDAGDAADLVEMNQSDSSAESAILSAVDACENSVVLQAPEVEDAVVAWNVLYEVAETIGRASSAADLLEHVADIIFNHLPVDLLVLMTCDGEGAQLTLRAVRRGASTPSSPARIATSRTIIRHVLESREGVLCANTMTDMRFGGEDPQGSISGLGLRSIICAPLVSGRQLHGISYLDCCMSRHAYTEEQLRVSVAIGRLVGVALENRQLLESRVHTERLAAVGETVAFLSHHIRNILQGLQGGADVVENGLERRSLSTAEAGWSLIRRNLDRILQLTINMLTFSKQRSPRMTTAPINPVIEEVVALVQKRAEEKRVRIMMDLEDTPPAPVDLDGIHQVVNNIVLNAVQAAPEGCGCVGIRTSYLADEDALVVSVEDNGPGIPEEEIESLFEPFQSSKGHGGTGLGLASASKIVRELRGKIEVDTAVGRGTTFHIKLPLAPDDSTDVE